jgi:DNA-binding NarL/FixJ family response regulator
MERVLMVDDDPRWRSLATQVLERADEIDQVMSVSSVAEAADAIPVFRPSIVVTDLRLRPEDTDDQGGVEVCRIARQADASTAVIVLTGHLLHSHVLALGPDVIVLDKALLSVSELQNTIRDAASLRRAA